jgi:DNA-directed RNA polymerase subunit RPC12/RpoP
MKIITVIGGIVAAICFFFAIIFGLASSVQATTSRLAVSGILFLIGVALIAVVWYMNRKPKTIVQRLEISGQMKAAQIKCPNCGGSVDANQIQITQGVPYAKCPYCGTTFEVTEEPKW